MTITAMVTTVALLGTGGIAAWQVGQMQAGPPVTNTSLALPAPRGPHGPAHRRGPGPAPRDCLPRHGFAGHGSAGRRVPGQRPPPAAPAP